ncbi:hypothetical protein P618_200277 [Holospora obtusa F1]|uniref:Uncharacterized protein n=1 Tax=Holospora obtusa F1 TaxID=1399147 RepID=W6TF18_HOLOB|nr:hypothetical protein [Holospora obtusa]ETZ07534.1 hypothetical protein P618_200277 [Holospora obtusa F1]
MLWALRTGSPFGILLWAPKNWKNTHIIFCAGQDKKGGFLKKLSVDPDYERLIIDASHIKKHLYAEKELNTKLHMDLDGPGHAGQSSGTVFDCK